MCKFKTIFIWNILKVILPCRLTWSELLHKHKGFFWLVEQQNSNTGKNIQSLVANYQKEYTNLSQDYMLTI